MSAPETIKTYLRPIDREGLLKFAESGREQPERKGTNKVHTVMQGRRWIGLITNGRFLDLASG